MKRKILTVLLLLIPISALIIQPEIYIDSVYKGLIIFCTGVLPSLFPFFFFTKILTSVGIGDSLSKMLAKPIRFLYNTDSNSGYIFAMSIMSGYPVGAKLLSDYCKCGLISNTDAKQILPFTSTSGPIFIIGTIGTILLKSKVGGFVILSSHILSALLNGFLYRKRSSESTNIALIPQKKSDDILKDAITSSIISVLIVGGYIAIFSMIADILINLKVIHLLANIFSHSGISYNVCFSLLLGAIEMTRGVIYLADINLANSIAIPLACAMISFGGLSITIQSMTYLGQCKIKPLYYLLTKLTHAIIAFILAFIICKLALV